MDLRGVPVPGPTRKDPSTITGRVPDRVSGTLMNTTHFFYLPLFPLPLSLPRYFPPTVDDVRVFPYPSRRALRTPSALERIQGAGSRRMCRGGALVSTGPTATCHTGRNPCGRATGTTTRSTCRHVCSGTATAGTSSPPRPHSSCGTTPRPGAPSPSPPAPEWTVGVARGVNPRTSRRERNRGSLPVSGTHCSPTGETEAFRGSPDSLTLVPLPSDLPTTLTRVSLIRPGGDGGETETDLYDHHHP